MLPGQGRRAATADSATVRTHAQCARAAQQVGGMQRGSVSVWGGEKRTKHTQLQHTQGAHTRCVVGYEVQQARPPCPARWKSGEAN